MENFSLFASSVCSSNPNVFASKYLFVLVFLTSICFDIEIPSPKSPILAKDKNSVPKTRRDCGRGNFLSEAAQIGFYIVGMLC